MDKLLDKIKKNIAAIKTPEKEKPSFFAISSTAKISPGGNAYCTPNRFFNCFNSAGCIVFTKKQAGEISSCVDGLTDYVLIDSEKSVFSQEDCKGQRVPLVEITVPLLKKSRPCFFKPNDITADAIWHFAMNICGLLMNRKVAVVGCGNVGSKAALKFIESGCHVSIYRRNHEAAELIADSFNILNSLDHGQVSPAASPLDACRNADIIIGATPGVPVVDIECLKAAAPHPVCIDAGKDSFCHDAIEYALKSGTEIFRTDITATLEGAISSILREELISRLHRGRKIINGVSIVSGGILGREGDIVVDSLLNTKHMYGVANGCGDFKRDLSPQDEENLRKLACHIESQGN